MRWGIRRSLVRTLKTTRIVFSMALRRRPVRQSDHGTVAKRMTPRTLIAIVVRMTASRARSIVWGLRDQG